MKQIVLFSTIAVLLANCGGSSGSGSKDRVMETSQSYSVSPGDKVIKTSQNTKIQITHVDGKEDSTVELIEGNATIIRK